MRVEVRNTAERVYAIYFEVESTLELLKSVRESEANKDRSRGARNESQGGRARVTSGGGCCDRKTRPNRSPHSLEVDDSSAVGSEGVRLFITNTPS